MKKHLLILTLFAFTGGKMYSQCNELFISEYVEGTGNNKAIEIYNPSGNSIALNNQYRLIRFNNGQSEAAGNVAPNAPINLGTHVIGPQVAWVIVLDQRNPLGTGQTIPVDAALQAVADTFLCNDYNISSTMYFNGNDAMALQKTPDGGTTWNDIDIFGQIGDAGMTVLDGTGGWSNIFPYDNATYSNAWTLNHTLIRQANVMSGVTVNPNPFIVSQQWDSLPVNTYSNLGIHTCDCRNYSLAITNLNCYGDNTGSITFTSVSFGTNPYQYSINGGVTYQSANTFSGLSAGTYSLKIKDINNVLSNPQSVTITQPTQIKIDSLGIIIQNANCGFTNGQISTHLHGGISPYHYLWSNSDTNRVAQNLGAGNYFETVTDATGCTFVSPTFTVSNILPTTPPLCMVTVDSLSTHNIVVWEKTGLPSTIDSFRIYREVATNVYSNIGSVSNDSLSEFHDYAANPNSTSFKYKLSVKDSCGNISAQSDYHNTIHLQYLGNGNLLWSLYSIENASNPVNFYIINRDDTGTGNFLPISSTIPGTNTSYTDVNFSSFPNARYRVDVSWSIACNPTRAISTTHSNIINLGNASVSQLEQANSITISPNPTASLTTISFSTEQTNTTIKITDILGQGISPSTTLKGTKSVTLDMSGYAKGIYFVQITDANKNMMNKKIIVQ